ncbi:hypothetical protein AN644_04945 [Candidatus Epulonipiscium fishelsonii]|nr:hypothetical protein AN644_04945 [Epulopiscium sp. SCG-C06WGA-EpuloA1]
MKILLATMSFDIGGVETHILELAQGLKAVGFSPVVASNGGIFEKDLKQFNIKHYRVPLHDKNFINMWKSYWLLKKIIEKEGFDVVHAHARIPAFILGILRKHIEFPFVTSVHAPYSTAMLYKLNSNWGEASLTVSEDLKKYLIKNYKFAPKDILVTINGISIDKFRANINIDDIKKEFNINTSKKIIGHVSRLDKDRNLAAKQLVRVAKTIYKKHPNTQIVIVGDGDEYEMIKSKAEKVNTELGINYVIMTGPRADINKFTAISDIFVGVSRAALEAMSSECPCILAGNEGYIGIFSKENLKSAIASNFTCRGEQKSTSNLLIKDIFKLLNTPQPKLDKLGEYGREVIKEYYSVERMTQDNIKLYKKVLSKV